MAGLYIITVSIMNLLSTLKKDIRVVFERDPAAKSIFEVLLCYPGLHAIGRPADCSEQTC